MRSMENDNLKMSLPKGGTVELRPVTPADDQFLLSVYAASRAEELAQVPWSDEQKTAFVQWQFGLQKNEYEATYPNQEHSVILVDDQLAGQIWVSRGNDYLRMLDIALLDEFQNRGVGTVLVSRLIDEAIRTNTPLRHMVFVLNENAKRFYERLGFVVFEEVGAYHHMEWRGTPE